ncbi:MAG: CsiV family protein [Oceanicoccus sp.]
MFTLITIYLASPAFGQSADEQQWYQVELIVFSRSDSAAMNGEAWPQEPGLKYPERVVELKPIGASEVVLDEWLADIDNSLAAAKEPAQQNASDSASNTTSASAAVAEPVLIQLPQQPFTLLENDQLQLTPMARRISRQNDFQQLFHGAWRQPIAARNVAESILIRGGTQYDDHYELEGSISLGLERYLHINTDLWLSTFVTTSPQDGYVWSVLPQAPATLNAERKAKNGDAFSIDDDFSATTSQNLLSPPSQNYDNFFSNLTSNSYAVEKTVTLRQQRRMRSNELHYIDHPLLGLIIKIIPYEFPEIKDTKNEEPDPLSAANIEPR